MAYQPRKPTFGAKEEPEVLTEIVNSKAIESLTWHKSGLLNVTFCKNSETTDNYIISSTVFGIDGKSSYTQYICSGPPCEVDGKNVIAFDGKQLPNNVVHLVTQSGQYENFLVLVVCWSGEYDDKSETYIGHFQYNAQINRAP